MKIRRYLSFFNYQTLIVMVVCLTSSAVCLYFQLSIYIDFIIVGLTIFFPLTFLMRSAFRRRERAIQYLSLFKGSLQSVYYAFQGAKIDAEKKNEFKNLATNISDKLLQYLLDGTGETTVQELGHAVYHFTRNNKKSFKRAFSLKIFLFIFRLNESIEFLIATKRHRTPWGVHAVVLFSIYAFIIFYPASLLHDIGFTSSLWYVFMMTGVKGLLLISLYNVEALMEDPFNQKGPDGIRVNDFRFSPVIPATAALVEEPAVTIVETMPDETILPESKDE
jgi:hypothetical protein